MRLIEQFGNTVTTASLPHFGNVETRQQPHHANVKDNLEIVSVRVVVIVVVHHSFATRISSSSTSATATLVHHARPVRRLSRQCMRALRSAHAVHAVCGARARSLYREHDVRHLSFTLVKLTGPHFIHILPRGVHLCNGTSQLCR